MSLFIDTLNGKKEPGQPTPIWLMRQAGRYSQAFLDLRAGKPFLDFCKQPELCIEATLLPIKEIEPDAAILFADILLVSDAMGLDLFYEPGRGPVFANPVRTQAAIDQLSVARCQEDVAYVYETVRGVASALPDKIPLIGFAGAPFTVAAYMVEGQSSKDFRHIKAMMWAEDGRFASLMDKMVVATVDYMRNQVAAGAQALQLFDTWVEALHPYDFEQYVRPYLTQIFDQLADLKVPLLYYGKRLTQLIPWLDVVPCSAFALGPTDEIEAFRRHFGNERALQGNLDPCVMFADESIMRAHVGATLRRADDFHKHVLNVGSGLTPDMTLDDVKRLMSVVRELA